MTDHGRALCQRLLEADGAYTEAMVAYENDPTIQNGPLRRRLRAELDRVNAEMTAYLQSLQRCPYPNGPAQA